MDDENKFPTPEDEACQWYRVTDLMDTHVTHYVAPTNEFSHGERIPDPCRNPKGPFHNDVTKVWRPPSRR